MEKPRPLFSWSLCLVFAATLFSISAAQAAGPQSILPKIHWLGQSAVKIESNRKNIYIDPYQLKSKGNADLLLITHSHRDHLDPASISKIVTTRTKIIAPADCVRTIKSIEALPPTVADNISIMLPGETTEWKGIQVQAVAAYNPRKKFHPKAKNWVGYLFTLEGTRIYHAGDTGRISEMKSFSCDIALLPLGQIYTMESVEAAAAAAMDVNAKVAIPIHFGMYEGTQQDAQRFKKLLESKAAVIIKKKEND